MGGAQSHNHTASHSSFTGGPGSGALVSNPSADIQVASNGHSHDFSFSVPTSTTTTVPPGMALNYIIRI